MGTEIKRLLIVDDDVALLRAYRRCANDELVVLTATTRAECLLAFERHLPDATVIDMHLPDGSGIELIATLREKLPGKPVALISANNTTTTTVAAMHAGATNVIDKPVTMQTLLAKLSATTPGELRTIDQAIWDHVHATLEEAGGNKSAAARRLKIDRNTLKRWLEKKRPLH